MNTHAASPLLNSFVPTAGLSRCLTDPFNVSFRTLPLLHYSLFLYSKI